MNAYELADEWDKNLKPHEKHGNHAETMYWIEQYRLYGSKAANMLRQQADRIAELEKNLHMTERHYERLCTEQSEPVAWIYKRNDGVRFLNWKTWKDCETCNGQFIPLYTTPHHASDVKQTKPLSDEEIKEVIRKHWNRKYGNRDMLTLCKAVLEEANT